MSGGTTMLAAKEQAFIDLHTQHSARVYRYIACRISDRHRAEELAADVFRIAWEKSCRNRPASAGCWRRPGTCSAMSTRAAGAARNSSKG